MRRSIYILVIVIALSGCQVQTWQPYAVLSYQPTPQPTDQPTAEADPAQPQATAKIEACVVIARETLNLRSGAGTGHGVIEVLSAGETLTPTGETSGEWLRVETRGGLIGWVNSVFVRC